MSIELSTSDFIIRNDHLYIKGNNNKLGMILIYADFCGHCTVFKPLYEKICTKLGNSFICAKIEDKNMSPLLKKQLDYKYYPTLKFFDQHGKIVRTFPDIERSEENILKFICDTFHHCKISH